MLKLNASYSKKVPVPGEDYSSRSFHASIECECADALTSEQLQAKIHDTFALVRDAVESELHGKPAAKAESTPVPAKPEAPKPENGAKATNKQIRFILDLARTKGMGLSDVNEQVQQKFKAESVYSLDRKQASRFVDELKAA